MFENKITYTLDEIDELLIGIYNGTIDLLHLPENLYFAISDDLLKDLYSGYGSKLSLLETGTTKYNNLNSLRKNIYGFAGAKTFQQVRDLQGMLIQKGKPVSFDIFRETAKPVLNTYNKVWQEVEADTTWKQADSASMWQEFQEEKDVLPNLKFQTVNDDRVRHDHAALDNIVRPVDDPFWNTHMPPLGWNCRCEVVQVEENVTPKSDLKGLPKPDKLFNNNPGKTGEVFEKKHPYFKVPKQWERERDANFGLPIPRP